jgi:hypothetical protein
VLVDGEYVLDDPIEVPDDGHDVEVYEYHR